MRSVQPIGKKPRPLQHPGAAPNGVTPAKAGVQLWAATGMAHLAEKLPDTPFELGATLQHLALPKDQHLPAGGLQARDIGGIPFHVAGELLGPVTCIRFRLPPILAGLLWMLMPETSMHEDDHFAGPEDEVGFAGQVFGVEAEAVAHAVDEGADQHFGSHAG